MTSEPGSERTPDQWKDYGDCRICRRRSYCKTTCTRRTRFIRLASAELMKRAMGQGKTKG